MTGKVSVVMVDSTGNKITENLGYTETEVSAENAQVFDTFGRAIAACTTNTYTDTIITYERSINEILADA